MSAVSVSDVRRGLALWLGENVESATWHEHDPYAPTDWAVTLRDLPSQPDTAVAVEVYHSESSLVLPGTQVRIQLAFRGRGDDADKFADEVLDALHGRHQFTAGAVYIQRARHLFAAPLDPDGNGRERRTDNYELWVMSAAPVGAQPA